MDIKIIKIAANSKNNRLLSAYDYISKQKSSICGDEIEISIKLKNKKISKIGYSSKSCIYTDASASLLSNYSKNKSLDEINELTIFLKKYIKNKDLKFPKKWVIFSKLINKKNLGRKDCLMLPFSTLSKISKKL
tara:strand:+ start:2483 stop:2884 length:402 start_codon:yes stop_codon:yes gene_type:complete